jgi:glycine/D-amino acid oxidase-like deaminating enzyme
MLNTMVTSVDDAGVTHGQGRIASHTVIWAAGVAASTLGRSLGATTDKAGRVLVKPGSVGTEIAGCFRNWRCGCSHFPNGDLCISGDASPVVVPHAFAGRDE